MKIYRVAYSLFSRKGFKPKLILRNLRQNLTTPNDWPIVRYCLLPIQTRKYGGHVTTPANRTDVKMTNVQRQISKATITYLAKSNINKERLTSLTDAMILLGHIHKSVTNLRRDHLRYVLPPGFKSICDTTTEASKTLLYGEDIKQNLKDAREHRRLTASLQQEWKGKRYLPSWSLLYILRTH